MKLIESKTLTTAAASIEFTSIPQDGTDLVLLYSTRGAGGGITLTFNGTTSGYSERLLFGEGSGTGKSSNRSSQTSIVWALSNDTTTTANTFSSGQIYIPNYAGSTNKSISIESVTENNATAANIYIDAALWSNTAAITSMQISDSSGNFVVGSIFSLYKIIKGSDGIVVVS
jgi:hypothetical protein